MSVVFALSSGSSIAATNPPFANPPSGKVIPTFTTVESVEDTVVGKNLRVGNSITPKTGTTLTLDAQDVNATKNLTTKGNLTSDADLFVSGSIKPKNELNELTLDAPLTIVQKHLNVLGKLNVQENTDFWGDVSVHDILTLTDCANGKVCKYILDVLGGASIKNLDIKENLAVGGVITAKSVGKFHRNTGSVRTVSKFAVGQSSASICYAGEVMMSCSLESTSAPGLFSGKHFSDGVTCIAQAVSTSNTPATYYASAVCFNPKGL